jgi:hypothetical protein|tara:strand:- start:20984 stop:21538 length:555 start_codon:yes stop_codon:yes gene_type:complete
MDEDKDDFMDLLSLDIQEKNEPVEDDDCKYMIRAEELDDDDIQTLAMAEALRTLSFNNEVIEEVKDMVVMGADAEFADAYSKLAKSNMDAVKIIADFALQKERLKNQILIKKMDIAGKKDVNEHKHELEMKEGPKQLNTTNNVIVTGRDDVFERLFGAQNDLDRPLEAPVSGKVVEPDSIDLDE